MPIVNNDIIAGLLGFALGPKDLFTFFGRLFRDATRVKVDARALRARTIVGARTRSYTHERTANGGRPAREGRKPPPPPPNGCYSN